jgi:hypothetical protein
MEQKRCEKLVSVYVDVNPITKKIFYVGIGVPGRISHRVRNKFHKQYVENLGETQFLRKIIHKNIPAKRAWEIEKQIIKKCGRLFNNTGYLTNVHEGGPLPFEDLSGYHWLRGKKLRDVVPHYKSRLNISYIEQYGEEKAKDIIERQTLQRNAVIQEKIAKNGTTLTPKLETALKLIAERRKRGEYTENELASYKRTAERQKNKSMQERLNDPNYVDPRKGKSAKEIYNDPNYEPHNKGKTAEELYGPDYIDPRSKSFYIQIDDQEPVFCKGDRDFREKFKAHDPLLYKLKQNKTHTIKRLKNTTHLFPDNSIVKYINRL